MISTINVLVFCFKQTPMNIVCNNIIFVYVKYELGTISLKMYDQLPVFTSDCSYSKYISCRDQFLFKYAKTFYDLVIKLLSKMFRKPIFLSRSLSSLCSFTGIFSCK